MRQDAASGAVDSYRLIPDDIERPTTSPGLGWVEQTLPSTLTSIPGSDDRQLNRRPGTPKA
jgi:hypothetical protein